MKTLQCYILCAVSVALLTGGQVMAFDVFAVDPSEQAQQLPDVDNGKIVWQQDAGANGWDILGVDLLADGEPLYFVVDNLEGNQKAPSIWNNTVVWEDDTAGADDWDVYLTDITDPGAVSTYLLTNFAANQTNPAVHGNTVVWQHEFAADDWDVYAANVTNPNDPNVYIVLLTEEAQYAGNQQAPAIYRNRMVWQDNDWGTWDIATTDLWLKTTASDDMLSASNLEQTAPAVWGDWVVWQEDFGNGDVDIYAANIADPANPVESALVADPAAQTNPDISGHLVVWQDNRNGHEDIYGYNLITRQEFRITTDTANQTNPVISGSLVVWEDMRDGVPQIYAAWLDGPQIAECPTKPAGDLDGDCKVNLYDFMKFAESWLDCNLDPIEACGP